MSNYEEVEKRLKKARCKSCNGGGTRNDADFGDISFNTWECGDCSGTGFSGGCTLTLTEEAPK